MRNNTVVWLTLCPLLFEILALNYGPEPYGQSQGPNLWKEFP